MKSAFSIGKKLLPLVPVFGSWKMAALAFGALKVGAPLALKGLNKLQEQLEARGQENVATGSAAPGVA